jgi:hypothetical protein
LIGCNIQQFVTVPATPVAEVKDVAIASQSSDGTTVRITVELRNPGDLALPLPEASYTLAIDGQSSYSFRDRPNRTLPAGGTQTVDLIAAVPVQVAAAAGYQVTGTIRYEPPGEIRTILTESYVPLPGSSFSSRGNLP